MRSVGYLESDGSCLVAVGREVRAAVNSFSPHIL